MDGLAGTFTILLTKDSGHGMGIQLRGQLRHPCIEHFSLKLQNKMIFQQIRISKSLKFEMFNINSLKTLSEFEESGIKWSTELIQLST